MQLSKLLQFLKKNLSLDRDLVHFFLLHLQPIKPNQPYPPHELKGGRVNHGGVWQPPDLWTIRTQRRGEVTIW